MFAVWQARQLSLNGQRLRLQRLRSWILSWRQQLSTAAVARAGVLVVLTGLARIVAALSARHLIVLQDPLATREVHDVVGVEVAGLKQPLECSAAQRAALYPLLSSFLRS